MNAWAPVEIVLLTVVGVSILSFAFGSFAPEEKGIAHVSFGLSLLSLAIAIFMYVYFSQ